MLQGQNLSRQGWTRTGQELDNANAVSSAGVELDRGRALHDSVRGGAQVGFRALATCMLERWASTGQSLATSSTES